MQPAVDRALALWLRPSYFAEYDPGGSEGAQNATGVVPRINGRYRRCASQQGSPLLYATRLGLAPDGCDQLAERLVHWQWPDGGWNCDRTPAADTSSFGETWLPMLGLYEYGRQRRDRRALEAARRASEVFLRRRLFRRVSNGSVMQWDFPLFHYPRYWHYDVLGGLSALARTGGVRDPRCGEALDLLEAKEHVTGGWVRDRRFYDRSGEPPRRGTDRVSWGPDPPRLNEWVTVDALTVLRAAGRYVPNR